ncbi:metal-binding protein [Streptomyces solincola]|uniref:Metal-binding protein n=1 Tax=Streptomyces solincola TaxID=2100817 RepID=A0A2S9PU86_9ACTN|nr:CYTH and CHAD domain-containing protein [Streptomyces solincola]PRH77981.1 metal-binding protein [Streptomyces solincola]
MADTRREIERKYEAAPGTALPDLTGTAGIARVHDAGAAELDAVYHDTADLRLAAAGVTLRRRTGGADAGWHLKLPVAPGVRDEVHAPLAEDVPDELAALVRARTRDAALAPLVRLRSHREIRHLLAEDGSLLAELATDSVRAQRLGGKKVTAAAWTEIEVELADGGDPALLDAVHKKLRKAGITASDAPSKLARALAETGRRAPDHSAPAGDTAGDRVLAYLHEQVQALTAYDPAVRRDLPDSVHKMRVATRRMRSAFKTYKKVLDPAATAPLGDELKWLAGELGADRDHEVLTERLTAHLDAVPVPLLLGPARARLTAWSAAGRTSSHAHTLAVLDGDRYTRLLDALHALLADPPLRGPARKDARPVLAKAVLKDFDRLARRVDAALATPAGHDRDVALHEARKAAKRARYAAEAARPALGKPAKKLAKAVKGVQKLLGDHQDGVVARDQIRQLAIKAHAAGETAFTWGLLYGREEAEAERVERALPQVWAETAERGRGSSLRTL